MSTKAIESNLALCILDFVLMYFSGKEGFQAACCIFFTIELGPSSCVASLAWLAYQPVALLLLIHLLGFVF